MILRMLSNTTDHQFSVTQRQARVFAGDLRGYHREDERLYVTGLSPIIDEAVDLLHGLSAGRGGRFYVNDGCVERAHDRSAMLAIAAITQSA